MLWLHYLVMVDLLYSFSHILPFSSIVTLGYTIVFLAIGVTQKDRAKYTKFFRCLFYQQTIYTGIGVKAWLDN